MLSEDSVEVVERFSLWLYIRSLFEQNEAWSDLDHGLLIQLYIFGAARFIPELQNLVIDAIIGLQDIDRAPLWDSALWSEALEGTGLRKLAVHGAARPDALCFANLRD